MVVATVVLYRGSTSSRLLWYRLLGKPAIDFSVVPVVGLQWITRSRKLWLHPISQLRVLVVAKISTSMSKWVRAAETRATRIMKIGAKQIMNVPGTKCVRQMCLGSTLSSCIHSGSRERVQRTDGTKIIRLKVRISV